MGSGTNSCCAPASPNAAGVSARFSAALMISGSPAECTVSLPTGDSTSADGALAVKANNRSYYAQGVESIVGINFNAWDWTNDLEVGLRYHEDEEDRLQHTDGYRMEAGGSMVLTSNGVPGASGGGDNRVGSRFVEVTVIGRDGKLLR